MNYIIILNLPTCPRLDFMVNLKYTNQELIYVLLFHIEAPHCTVFNKYIPKILKVYVKDENSNGKKFQHVFQLHLPIENDGIAVSLDATSLYTSIPIIYTLYIIRDYVNNDDQFTRKTAIPRDEFLT